MKNNFKKTKIIFQLSSPRSGSTLLAQMFNSSDNLCLINEPYTKDQFLFKDKEISSNHILEAFKYTFFFIKRKDLRFLFFLLIKIINNLCHKIGFKSTIFSKIYHVNSLNQSLWKNFYNSISKKKKLDFILFKCIRLRKASNLISKLDQENLIIIHLIRHPLEVIDSQIKQRNLNFNTEIIGDLSEYISNYPEDKSFILKHYKPNCSITQLALNWTLTNNYIFNNFKNNPNFHLISYENLCSNEFKSSFPKKFKLKLSIPNQISFSKGFDNPLNDRNIFKQREYFFNSNLLKKYSDYNLSPIFNESVLKGYLNL